MTAEMHELQGGRHADAYIPGDPEEWTPGQHDRNARMVYFMDALRSYGTLSSASEAIQVDQATVWRWREHYPVFRDAVTQFLTRDRQAAVEDNLYRIATSTDPRIASATVKAIEFQLKALDRDTYGDQTRIDQTVTVNQQVQVVHTVRDEFRAKQEAKLAALRSRTIDEPRELPEAAQ